LDDSRPTEAKEYNFHLKAKAFDMVRELETKLIHIKGWGYQDKSIQPENLTSDEIPLFKCTNNELSPEAFFSLEEIDYGEVQAKEYVPRFVLLHNNSTQSKLEFNFEAPSFIW
jgi:hypothetical protein